MVAKLAGSTGNCDHDEDPSFQESVMATLAPTLTFSKYVQKGKYQMGQQTLTEQMRDGNLFANSVRRGRCLSTLPAAGCFDSGGAA